MKRAPDFIAGAASRLLPMSVPFRFFAAAVALHVASWLALLAGADAAIAFAGGLALPLASLHLATIGVLAITAIGASLQLLPVATRRPVASARAPSAIFAVVVPAVGVLAFGMGARSIGALAIGALATAAALVAYAALLARNLAGAKGMPIVVAHGWAALVSLVVALASGAALALSYTGAIAVDRGATIALHVAFAVYGFMGMLAMGVSYILLPMFALAPAPDERRARVSVSLAIVALALAALAAAGIATQALRVASVLTGAAAFVLHLRLMSAALRGGLRRTLGPAMALVRAGWAAIGASFVAALAIAAGAPLDRLPTLFAALAVGGLVTFLLGILARIAPFLASMHAAGAPRSPTPSQLTHEQALAVHVRLHVAALALLVAAIAADSVVLARVAAAIGAAGATAFAVFFAAVWRRAAAARALKAAPPCATSSKSVP